MKKISFRVRNFESEQFLTFNIDNDAELDEDILDYLEEEEPEGIVPVIFEPSTYAILSLRISPATASASLVSVSLSISEMKPSGHEIRPVRPLTFSLILLAIFVKMLEGAR